MNLLLLVPCLNKLLRIEEGGSGGGGGGGVDVDVCWNRLLLLPVLNKLLKIELGGGSGGGGGGDGTLEGSECIRLLFLFFLNRF